MDNKKMGEIDSQARQFLLQIAAELEAAAAGARSVAAAIPNRELTGMLIQQFYARLDEANHLVKTLQRTIDEAVKDSQK
jgi:hypothetical protein